MLAFRFLLAAIVLLAGDCLSQAADGAELETGGRIPNSLLSAGPPSTMRGSVWAMSRQRDGTVR